MRCAAPSCLGGCTSKSPFTGVGNRCRSGDGFDPAGARMDSVFDEPWTGAHEELDRRHLEEAGGVL